MCRCGEISQEDCILLQIVYDELLPFCLKAIYMKQSTEGVENIKYLK
jgi:hypothetical protein